MLLGLVTSVTGPASSSFGQATVDGAEARIDEQNAAGGVNGRKIKLVTADDASTGPGALTATQSLIQKDKVFALLAATASFFTAYRFTGQEGVPVLGAGVDGPEWGDPSNSNLFNPLNGSVNPDYPAFAGDVNFMKQIGATKVGVVAIGGSPSSVGSTTGMANGLKKAGIAVPVMDQNTTFGQTDFSADALAMKNAGVNAIISSSVAASNLALLTALKQDGVKLKGEELITAYSQSILATPASRQAAQGADFESKEAPTAANTPATKNLMSALRKYVGYTGANWEQGQMWGWATADAAIAGLERAGKNFTRKSYIAALRSDHDYTEGGLLGAPIDFSKWGYYSDSGGGNCFYQSQVQGDNFVPLNGGKPYCGGPIPGTNGA